MKEPKASERIFIEWSDGTTVLWKFEPHGDDATIVDIENAGFKGDADEVIQQAIESIQSLTIVLCDLKTLLEQGSSTNLVSQWCPWRSSCLWLVESTAPAAQ